MLTNKNTAMIESTKDYVFDTNQWLTIISIIIGSLLFFWRVYNTLKRSDSKNDKNILSCNSRIDIIDTKISLYEKISDERHKEIIDNMVSIRDVQEANRKLMISVDKKLDNHIEYERGRIEKGSP
jgi:Na+/phosphate symporter